MFPGLLTDTVKIPKNCSEMLGIMWEFGDSLYYTIYSYPFGLMHLSQDNYTRYLYQKSLL
jgi:hypothetical protein